MKFFCFIDYGFNVGTFEESDFSNNMLKYLLVGCEVVMRHMPDCLKAIGKGYET